MLQSIKRRPQNVIYMSNLLCIGRCTVKFQQLPVSRWNMQTVPVTTATAYHQKLCHSVTRKSLVTKSETDYLKQLGGVRTSTAPNGRSPVGSRARPCGLFVSREMLHAASKFYTSRPKVQWELLCWNFIGGAMEPLLMHMPNFMSFRTSLALQESFLFHCETCILSTSTPQRHSTNIEKLCYLASYDDMSWV